MSRALFIIVLCMMTLTSSYARESVRQFTVYLNGNPFVQTQDVSPCSPIMARFTHPNPDVVQVRMRYPLNWFMYRIYPIDMDVHIDVHEDFMEDGRVSYSDFIAEDLYGNDYGKITLTFIPISPREKEELCKVLLNS